MDAVDEPSGAHRPRRLGGATVPSTLSGSAVGRARLAGARRVRIESARPRLRSRRSRSVQGAWGTAHAPNTNPVGSLETATETGSRPREFRSVFRIVESDSRRRHPFFRRRPVDSSGGALVREAPAEGWHLPVLEEEVGMKSA